MGTRTTHLLTSLALLVACGLQAQEANLIEQRRNLPARVGPNAVKGPDRPDLRREWNLEWFGGRLSPDYLDYKNKIASQEVQRWKALLPQPGNAKQALAAPAAAVAPLTWANLGPTANLTTTSFPDIDSGRLVAIISDPNAPSTLYVATCGGGIFKSTNADPASTGNWTWTAITDGLPTSGSGGNVAVGAMAMNPSNSSTLYLGAGDSFDDEGRGFYTTTDGGGNWTPATGIGAATRSHAILPLTASTIFWGTNDGLKVSHDGGSTFSPVTVGGTTTDDIWSIQKVTATDLVCTLKNGSGQGSIHYSSDGGSTWTAAVITGVVAANLGRITVAAATDGTTLWAIREDTSTKTIARGVLKSVDKGRNWTWIAAPTAIGGLFQGASGDGEQSWYNQCLAVDPNNPNNLFVGANLSLYRSMNGGASWTQLTSWLASKRVYAHADFHTAAWSGSGGTLYVGNDGGLSVVRDPFRIAVPTGTGSVASDPTFIDNRRNRGLSSHLVLNLGSTTAATPADSKFRISLGMQDNGTRVRQPAVAGNALTGSDGIFEDRVGGDGFATLIHPADGNQILGSLYYCQIQSSTDGGNTFYDAFVGISEANVSTKAPFYTKLAQGDATHPSTVYTFTNGVVYKSLDFGGSWSAMGTTGLPPAGTTSASDPTTALYIRNIGASSSDANVVGIAGNQGRFFFTANGGSSWSQAAAPTNNGSYTSYVWFDRSNPATVYAASVAPDATRNHLWKSTNTGASWTALDGSASTSNGFPFGIPVHVVQTDPRDNNTIYAGTDFGVYATTDGGITWARFGTGLPMVSVRDLYIAPDGSFIRAAAYGRGVWELQSAPVGPTLSVSPSAVTMVNGGTQNFYPTVTGGTANTVTWSASSGTIGAGPTASGVAQSYTAPASGASATVTATTVDTPVATATAAITLVAPAAVSVAVSPASVELMTGSATQSFTAAVSPLTNQAVTWTGTGVNGSGRFSASGLAAGSYTVTATSAASPTSPAGTATVTLVAPSSVTVTVAPAPATALIGATKQFSATVSGLSAGNQGVTWTVSGGGTISNTGLFTATTAGSFTVTATNTFSGVTGSATVAVKSMDLDANGTTDLRDLLFFAQNYGTSNAACDLNGSGTVNDADLDLLIAGL